MDIIVTPDGRVKVGRTHYACALGKGGRRRDKHEGDGATPIGRFPLRRLFFRADRVRRPDTQLPARPVLPSFGWCDGVTIPQYNRLIRRPFLGRHEMLWREDHLYDLIIEVGYNDAPPKPGLGSAIFVHVARDDYAPTEGCVALATDDLHKVLRDLSPGSHLEVQTPA